MTDELVAQLVVRVPQSLHRRMKLYCTEHEITIANFLAGALREKLGAAPAGEASPARRHRFRHEMPSPRRK
jgi:hypothetical protein